MIHQNDAKNETDFQLMKTHAMAAIKPNNNRLMQVYTLAAAAAEITPDQEFLESVFSEALTKYFFKR